MGNPKVELLCEQLESAREDTLKMAKALPEQARLFQPAEGRPTAMWLIGHLGNSMNSVIMRWCLRQDHVFPREWSMKFAPDFRGGEPPSSDASKYPSFDEVVKLYDDAMTKTIAAVRASVTDEALDQPLPGELPEQVRTFFPTIGKSLNRMIAHDAYHRGQAALLGKLGA